LGNNVKRVVRENKTEDGGKAVIAGRGWFKKTWRGSEDNRRRDWGEGRAVG